MGWARISPASPWWLIWQLPAALVFLVAAVAELNRPPFDTPIADSEIVMGPFTEYGGLRFAFFLLAEYAGIVLFSVLFSVLVLFFLSPQGHNDAESRQP